MLQRLKNKIRLVRDKFQKVGKGKKFFVFAMVTAIILFVFAIKTSTELPRIAEENYYAIDQLIYTMVEEKSTDVKFDTSKIENYTVDNKSDGNKNIVIYGADLERVKLQLSDNYQITELKKESESTNIIWFYIMLFIICFLMGCLIIWILSCVISLIKKIVKFFKE